MRLLILALVSLTLYFNAAAQKDTVFYDKNWNVITGKANAEFFRLKPVFENGTYKLVDYYISGYPQMIGHMDCGGPSFEDKKCWNGKFEYFHPNGKKESEGIFRNGVKEGKWLYYDIDGNLVAKTPPEPKYDLAEYLGKHVYYPDDARERNIEGNVKVSFSVDIDGTIADVKVIKSLHPSCDRVAFNAVSLMPAWKPGEENGKPVKVTATLPVKFQLVSGREWRRMKRSRNSNR